MIHEPPRYAVVTPYASVWLLAVLRAAGIDSQTVRADASKRRQHGYPRAADDLEQSWQQLAAAAAWHAAALGNTEPATRRHTTPSTRPVNAEVFGTRDAAQLLGVGPRRVRQLLAAGQLTGRRVAGAWLIEATSVEQLNAARHHEGNAA